MKTIKYIILLQFIFASSLAFAQIPPNDEIQNATNVLNLPFEDVDVQLQNATTASSGGMNGCDFSDVVNRVYYRYKPSTTGTVSISTSSVSTNGKRVKVYQSNTEFASSDSDLTQVDDTGCNFNRNIIMDLQADQVYYFLISNTFPATIYIKDFDYSDVVDIPDDGFKNALTSTICADVNGDGNQDSDVDTNNDFEIQISEAQAVFELSIISQPVGSIEGISSFDNITNFRLQGAGVSSMDLSSLTQLETLILNLNAELTSLDVSNLFNLKSLNCGNNGQLASINFGTISNLENLVCFDNDLLSINTLSNLKYINCSGNNISTLDVSSYSNLEFLSCSSNPISSLDVSNLTNLEELWCQFTNLSLINLDGATALREVQMTNNDLFDVDTSSLINLEILFLGNNPNLTYLNTKNGIEEQVIQIANNTNIEYICTDTFEAADVLSSANIAGSTSVVNSYCSFVPGGDYNTITGSIIFDNANDGCDLSDGVFPFYKINLDDGIIVNSNFSNNAGEYNFYTQDGTFTVTPDIENSSFFNLSPTNETINFPDTDNNVEVQDFCITANGIHPDVEIALASTIPARPGFDAEYLITYRNKGNQTLSGGITLSYNAEVMDYVSSSETPAFQVGTFINWTYLDLLPFESRSIYVTLNVNSPMESPAVNIDDVLSFTVEADPIAGDEFPDDNIFNFDQTVVGSFDPNDIACMEGDVVEPSEIGNYLHYLIRFENTGNAAAENVVVKTEVDPTQFDISTLRLLSSSQDVDVRVSDNTIEFIFEGINLNASGGHGNILLRMKTKQTLDTNDTVTKNAEIYFDYNFPIETNDANTTFATLSVSDYENDKSVSLYPNPVKNTLNIEAKNVINSVSLYDVQGRLLQTKINSSKQIKIDLSSRANGIYFIKTITDAGINVEKIVKK